MATSGSERELESINGFLVTLNGRLIASEISSTQSLYTKSRAFTDTLLPIQAMQWSQACSSSASGKGRGPNRNNVDLFLEAHKNSWLGKRHEHESKFPDSDKLESVLQALVYSQKQSDGEMTSTPLPLGVESSQRVAQFLTALPNFSFLVDP